MPHQATDYMKNLHVILIEDTQKFNIERGVKQGETISPKLFTVALESILKKLEWSKLGVESNGHYLNNLKFADDIVLIACNN